MFRTLAAGVAAAMLASSGANAATVVVTQTLTLDQAHCFCEDPYIDTGFSGGVDVDVAVGDTLDLTYDFLGDQQLQLNLLGVIFPFLIRADGEPSSAYTVTGALSLLDVNGGAIFTTTTTTWSEASGNAIGQIFFGDHFAGLTLPATIGGLRWVGTLDAYDGVITSRRYDQAWLGIVAETEKLGVAAVPEPGAWALMIAGFGLAGAGLRARRRALA